MQDPKQEPAYRSFIQTLVAQDCVYTLIDEEDFFAECPSETEHDMTGEALPVYCFWDNEADALACQSDEWQDYQLQSIDLEEFMADILTAMQEDNRLVGVAFDAQLFGSEAEPLEILSDLLDEIVQQNKKHLFTEWDNLNQYVRACQKQISNNTLIH